MSVENVGAFTPTGSGQFIKDVNLSLIECQDKRIGFPCAITVLVCEKVFYVSKYVELTET